MLFVSGILFLFAKAQDNHTFTRVHALYEASQSCLRRAPKHRTVTLLVDLYVTPPPLECFA